jgi:hypothetical protein
LALLRSIDRGLRQVLDLQSSNALIADDRCSFWAFGASFWAFGAAHRDEEPGRCLRALAACCEDTL